MCIRDRYSTTFPTLLYLRPGEPPWWYHMTRCRLVQHGNPIRQTPLGQCRAECHTSCWVCAPCLDDGTQLKDRNQRPWDGLKKIEYFRMGQKLWYVIEGHKHVHAWPRQEEVVVTKSKCHVTVVVVKVIGVPLNFTKVQWSTTYRIHLKECSPVWCLYEPHHDHGDTPTNKRWQVHVNVHVHVASCTCNS